MSSEEYIQPAKVLQYRTSWASWQQGSLTSFGITLYAILFSGSSYALALLSSSMEGRSSSSSVARTRSLNCSTLVALAIGAVMLGRAISHAKATCAGVA